MITSSDSEFDEVMGMNLGADDYVTKPYGPAVPLARISSLLRRSSQGAGGMRHECKGVVLDLAAGAVECCGRKAGQTRNGLKILHVLMRSAGTVLTRQEIVCDLWESDAFIDDNTLTVNVNRLRKTLAASGELLSQQVGTNMMLQAVLYLVVSDEVVEAMKDAGAVPALSYVDIMYADGVSRAEGDAFLREGIALMQPDVEGDAGCNNGFSYQSKLWPVSNVFSASAMVSQMGGMRLIITYLALHIGFVFLIATAALLAIQQLSETADSLPRYRTLSEIGCDASMIFRSLRSQTLFYFLAPLALAACHAACAITVMSSTLFSALGTPVYGAIAFAAALVVVVYGTYLAITYFASRSIVGGAAVR